MDKEVWYIYTIKFYSAIEKNEFLKFAEKRTIFQITLLNETIKKANTTYSFSYANVSFEFLFM